MKKLLLTKSKRLLRNEDFKAVLVQNKKTSDGLITLYVAENTHDFPRLGVSVGKAYGNAVERNRLKRLLREVFRQNQHRIPQNLDYVIIVPSKSKLSRVQSVQVVGKKVRFEELQESFLRLVDIITTQE
ncbi:MAG: ribonuclease P protein component [Planctomycetota bacterium]